MTDRDSRTPTSGSSRREFLLVGASTVAAPALAHAAAAESERAAQADPRAPVAMTLHVNGSARNVALDARTTLLDALREHLGLTGTKKGCDHGQCGACTVMLGDHRVLSCLTLAASVQSRPVTTIEGLAKPDGELHPVQQAFIDQDAFQCGYCTPGQIISAVACIREGHAGNDGDIREYMSGNICRCAAYPNIVTAVKQAKTAMAAAATGSGR
jgi:xanthine dehydrogenase YagT iron-sulfur-binding subunit